VAGFLSENFPNCASETTITIWTVLKMTKIFFASRNDLAIIVYDAPFGNSLFKKPASDPSLYPLIWGPLALT
jgi:hypothetical protein